MSPETVFPEPVQKMLRLGFPRLALAQAQGLAFVPCILNVRATFGAKDTVVRASSDEKITSDTIIDSVVCRVTLASYGLFTDGPFFPNAYGSGFDVALDITGAKRVRMTQHFIPLASLHDITSSMGPWGIGQNQKLSMDFRRARPVGMSIADQSWRMPVTLVVSFRGHQPYECAEMLSRMSEEDAMAKLHELFPKPEPEPDYLTIAPMSAEQYAQERELKAFYAAKRFGAENHP